MASGRCIERRRDDAHAAAQPRRATGRAARRTRRHPARWPISTGTTGCAWSGWPSCWSTTRSPRRTWSRRPSPGCTGTGRGCATRPRPSAYLRTAVVNGSRSVLRRRRTARDYVPPHQVNARSAESLAMLSAEHQAVVDALATLPPRQREVLVLRYYGGLCGVGDRRRDRDLPRHGEVHGQPGDGHGSPGDESWGTMMTVSTSEESERRLAEAMRAQATGVGRPGFVGRNPARSAGPDRPSPALVRGGRAGGRPPGRGPGADRPGSGRPGRAPGSRCCWPCSAGLCWVSHWRCCRCSRRACCPRSGDAAARAPGRPGTVVSS